MDVLGNLNLEEEAKDGVKERNTTGSKNDPLFSNRYTIVDNNFEDDENGDGNFNFNKSNENMNINDSNRNTEIEKKENIGENISNRESSKFRRNIIDLKIILLGNAGVGKTCIVGRYINNSFSNAYKSTIQAELNSKVINEDNDTSIRLKIWDTIGQEKYRSITRQYYRDALGAIVVFDLTDKKSFDDVKEWMSDLKNNGEEDTVIIILGNKSDLSAERLVTQEEIKQSFGNTYPYYDVSAKNGNNISLAFDKLKKLILENLKKKEKIEMNNYNNSNDLKIKKKKLKNEKGQKTQSLDDIDKNLKQKDKKCC